MTQSAVADIVGPAVTANAPQVVTDPITKLRKNIAAYNHPQAHRTSNMVDRLMQRMDRHLFSTQYFHGSVDAAKLSIRGLTRINNFAPGESG